MLIRRLFPGEIVPLWYGRAYLDPLRPDMGVYILIPLNLVVRFVRAVWWRMQLGGFRTIAEERFKWKAYQDCRKRVDEMAAEAWDEIRTERAILRADRERLNKQQEMSKC